MNYRVAASSRRHQLDDARAAGKLAPMTFEAISGGRRSS
jgi:hypothetical protein